MDNLILIITILVLVGLIVFLLIKEKSAKDTPPQFAPDSFLLLQNQLQELHRTLDTKIGESSKEMQNQMHAQLSHSTKIVQDVTEKLTKLDETNKQVLSFSDQLKNLQDILKNPKQRGIMGEFYLETVLKNVLPPGSYQMQYAFPNGDIVDAAVFVGEHVIPIDAKFSLENYNRIIQEPDLKLREPYEKLFRQDLKTRIDETSKYIKPRERTMDFAFMFIPAEGVYYDLLVNRVGGIDISSKDLIEYAAQKHVIIVSPTSFLAYLQTVLQGLRGMQIQKEAGDIRKRVEDLGKHLLQYENYVQKMGGQLGTLVNTYNTSYKELKKIDKDVIKISGESRELGEVIVIEKPDVNEEE